MLQLKTDTLILVPRQKIIKAATYANLLDARGIVEAAHTEALKITNQAKAQFESEKQRGFQEGLAEGKARIAQHMMESITSTITSLESFESEVVEIVLQAVKRILGELDKKELITKVAKNALALVKNQKRVTLRVCPKDADRLTTEIDGMLAKFSSIHFIDVVPDPRLGEGDAMLETDIGAVDARLETQLAIIRKSLTKAVQ